MRRRKLLFMAATGVGLSQLPYHALSDPGSSPSPGSSITPDASDMGPIRAIASVDWASGLADTTPMVFGCNDYEVMTPEKAANREFQAQMQKIDFRLLRLHNANMADRWSSQLSRRWDPDKIMAAFQAASYLRTSTVVQNIPNWTQWMQKDDVGRLHESEVDRYAQFCADLVQLLNVRQRRNIKFWEPINEAEPVYERAGSLDRLWTIFNRAAVAMKQVDPTISVGGPVISWSDPQQMRSFLVHSYQHVDFLSWHRYATGNPRMASDRLMTQTSEYGKDVVRFRKMGREFRPEVMPLFLSEYNLNYNWKAGETRHHGHIGAVWFASVLKHLAENNVDMAAVWHAKDNIYGLLDSRDRARPAAKLYEWCLDYMVGKTVATDTNHPMVEAWAVEQAGGDRSIVLINKAAGPAMVKLSWPIDSRYEEPMELLYLNHAGNQTFSYDVFALQEESFSLLPHSLLLLRVKK
jgi:hypothetical protein